MNHALEQGTDDRSEGSLCNPVSDLERTIVQKISLISTAPFVYTLTRTTLNFEENVQQLSWLPSIPQLSRSASIFATCLIEYCSSGMMGPLAFSVGIMPDSQLLLIDENFFWLSIEVPSLIEH